MKNRDTLGLAFRNLMRRKARTILTILSVVIGIFSIILMLSFGFGIQKQQEAFLKQLGGLTSLTINPKKSYYPGSNEPVPTNGIITDKVLAEIKKNPKVKGFLAAKSTNINMSINKKNYELWARIVELNTKDLRENGIKMEDGSDIPELKKNEYLISADVYPTIMKKVGAGEYSGENDLNFDFSKEKVNFLVGYKNSDGGIFTEDKPQYEEIKATYRGRIQKSDMIDYGLIIVNEETAKILNEKYEKLTNPSYKPSKKKKLAVYEEAKIFVHDIKDVQSVKSEIEQMDLYVHSMQDYIETEKERNLVIQLVLGGIGSIALLVAAIGISNTMLMSIQERTKEIGVMKVIGAQIKDIRKMFLLEAMLIGIIGGIVGVIFSYIGSQIANTLSMGAANGGIGVDSFNALDTWRGISYIPFWLPVIAVIFSAFVGLLAGYLPARKATKLSAIQAIRTN